MDLIHASNNNLSTKVALSNLVSINNKIENIIQNNKTQKKKKKKSHNVQKKTSFRGELYSPQLLQLVW